MSEIHLERVSAFVDGEVSDKEVQGLIDTIETNVEAQKRWARYHLVGDALRKNLPKDVKTDLAARVAKALENEPAIMAPNNLPGIKYKPSTQRPVSGYAIAASIAAIGFGMIGVAGMVGWVDRGTGASNVANVMPASLTSTEQSMSIAESIMPASTIEMQADIEADAANNAAHVPRTGSPKVHAYVLSHEQEASAAAARPGLPPNVRTVTFSPPVQ